MKKAISIFICLLLAIGSLPLTIFAAPESANAEYLNYWKLQLQWDAASGNASAVEIGGESYPIILDTDGQGYIVLPLPAGQHTGSLLFGEEKVPFSVDVSADRGFIFHGSDPVFDRETGEFSMTWNAADAQQAKMIAVIVGDKRHTVSDSNGSVTGQLSNVPLGKHTLAYVLKTNAGAEYVQTVQQLLICPGTLKTSMPLDLTEDGYVLATLLDEENNPVAGQVITCKFGSMTDSKTTDSQGQVIFNALPVEEHEKDMVQCIFEPSPVPGNVITYIGCIGSFNPIVIPTAPTTDPTTSDSTTDNNTTTSSSQTQPGSTSASKPLPTLAPIVTKPETTYPTIQGPGTTSLTEEGYVMVNAITDSNILNLFGLKQSEFDARARLLLPTEQYSFLIGNSKGTLMLKVLTSVYSVNEQQIESKMANNSRFSSYDSSKVLSQTIRLGVQFVDKSQGTDTALEALPDAAYIIRLPVPKNMQNCERFAISVVTTDGLHDLYEMQAKDGYVEFQIDKLANFVLLGFPAAGGLRSVGGVPTIVIVLIVLGVLLLIGAGLLIYFFVIRKPAEDEDEDDVLYSSDPSDFEQNGVQLKSSPDAEQRPLDTAQSDDVSLGDFVSLYSTEPKKGPDAASHPGYKKKNPRDYDLDL